MNSKRFQSGCRLCDCSFVILLSAVDLFGASRHVSASGVGDGPVSAPPATGYTVIAADSLDAAVAGVDGHPHIKHGGQVSVYETFQM